MKYRFNWYRDPGERYEEFEAADDQEAIALLEASKEEGIAGTLWRFTKNGFVEVKFFPSNQ